MSVDKKDQEEMLKKAYEPAKLAMKYHPYYEGKIEITAKCPVHSFNDLQFGTHQELQNPVKIFMLILIKSMSTLRRVT